MSSVGSQDALPQGSKRLPEHHMTWSRVTKPARPSYVERKSKGRAYWTTQCEGEVRLRLNKNLLEEEAPITVHDMFLGTATKFADNLALCSKYKKDWHLFSYIEYYEECRRAAKAFLQLGLRRFHGVGIMGCNSAEWVIASIGAIMAGGISVAMLSSSSPRICHTIAENSKINIFVVDNDKQLQKINQIQASLTYFKAIVQYKEELQTKQHNLYSWRGFLDLADRISDEKLDHIIDSQKPNQCCTLVYSLGDMGPPKILMLSHDNITWTTAATVQSLAYKSPPEGQEVLVSYLPLSSISAQILDMWVAIAVAGTLYFAPPEAVRETDSPQTPGAGFLFDLLREVKPTTFYGVPWIWEHILDNLKASQLESSRFRRRINAWAMRLGLRTNQRRMFGQVHPPLCFNMAKKLVFDPVRKFLGLHHCEQFFNLGLGLPRTTLDFFLSLNIPIYEHYGLSECTGIHTLSSHQAFRLLSCGKELLNTNTKVEEKNEEGIGHLSLWGRHIFMGYLNNYEHTRRRMDSQGRMYTEDLGFLDSDKFLYIIGSLKDMITLKSGEVINPNPIEERVKNHIPIIHYVVVVGQDAPYLGALLTLKCQVNWETGEPRSALTSEVVAQCRSLRSQATWLSDVLHGRDPIVDDFIKARMEAANAEAPSASSRIIKWVILDTDFSVCGGELGATTKLKRAIVYRMYQEEIQKLYK
ncbi:long-chain-fatty-acid--CoA ligase ACSBG2-like [Perognathus longimembris pacificus]|uniref:long-chain-fatty-acid--CoA ligase ACSBG2-like n=1 Tax=Perognathus longimembris pacificus TaxID=214514 RepID=UPI0020198D56|nr:long-chain-fatty-acid--CoA ligase ACSBG2-like [Perognathus longimembris pacificus]